MINIVLFKALQLYGLYYRFLTLSAKCALIF